MGTKGGHYSSWGDSNAELHILTSNDLNYLHSILLNMYKDIKKTCDKYGIRVVAAGGTALGAVRHNGFIPWDDDMDLFIYRKEFELFKSIFNNELGNKYYLLYPGSINGANCFLPRIIKKGTTLLNMIDETAPYPHGIYIDINIIEYAPSNKLYFRYKAIGADLRRFISYSVYWFQYKSNSLKNYLLNTKGANYYRLRMLIGRFFSWRSAEKWFASFDRFVRFKETDVFTVPSGTKKYIGERLTLDIIEPFNTIRFEDTEILVFNNFDWYLTNLYGDYMVIPNENQREHHLCLKLSFNEE